MKNARQAAQKEEYMDFKELAEKRYSVRSYRETPVEPEKVRLIMRAASLAPTAKNCQPLKILVIQGEEAREKLKKCTVCHYGAPLAFIVFYDRNQCYGRSFDGKISGDVDASIVTTHMMLQAADAGLGSCWVLNFDPSAVMKEFEVPENLVPSSILIAGYASDSAAPSPRHSQSKPDCELFAFDRL